MAFQLSTGDLLVSVLCAFLSYALLKRAKKAQHPYPPGPQPKPIIGNAFDLPFRKSWIKYFEWSKEYNSDIIHLCALNTHIVVLNTMDDIAELLDRRSANYSSRPWSPVINMMGFENLTSALPYGTTLRKHRKFLEESLRKDTMPSYLHIHVEKVHLLLDRLLHDPAGFAHHCKMLSTSIAMATTYGYDIAPEQIKDRFVESAEFIVENGADLTLPGRTLIVAFPFLRHIPPWIPGASTQRLGAQCKEVFLKFRSEPVEYVKRNMADGMGKDCIVKRLLERYAPLEEEILKDVISLLYFAQVETMQIVETVFFLAMTLHPLEQKKAQEEIDRVVGSDRLPTFEDRNSLPYIEALYREVLRWRPVLPLSVPHSTLEDDIYKGYLIPKGTVILPNVWAVTRNPTRYPEPESFRPERFFNVDGTLIDDSTDYIFGFGRRVCPGKYMADLVTWLMMVSVLAMFSISKAKDENGNEIAVDANAFTDAISSHPLPFKCTVVPRSTQASALIKDAASIARQNLQSASR